MDNRALEKERHKSKAQNLTSMSYGETMALEERDEGLHRRTDKDNFWQEVRDMRIELRQCLSYMQNIDKALAEHLGRHEGMNDRDSRWSLKVGSIPAWVAIIVTLAVAIASYFKHDN